MRPSIAFKTDPSRNLDQRLPFDFLNFVRREAESFLAFH